MFNKALCDKDKHIFLLLNSLRHFFQNNDDIFETTPQPFDSFYNKNSVLSTTKYLASKIIGYPYCIPKEHE